ncbi:helix-turn-helix domain-containing protein [Variovorax sp. W6]|uniref:helix-turn-helix domain-containing protein n=1 Tax=Variovorax sp. W6 TaxID=3093895 RepID=UPI003D805C05
MKEIKDSAETEAPSGLNDRIAQRVRDLRAARGLSLDALAAHCGVSRSMISLVERGESSPTAVVLEKLATGLGVSLASLFEAPAPAADPVSRLADQLQWRDPHSGYLRRNVSPGGFASPIQIVEVEFPPGARVAYETSAREPLIHQQVWVLDGVIELTVGDEQHRLATGDCLAMVLDRPTSFHNPSRKSTRYVVVIATMPSAAASWR